jgi:hypothetical protein
MLAVNDEGGNFTGRAAHIEIDDWIKLEGPGAYEPGGGIVCHRVPRLRLRIGGMSIRITGYGEYVGNIMWDCAHTNEAEAARVLNYLKRLGTWNCTEAASDLFQKWAHGPEFTAEDFSESD